MKNSCLKCTANVLFPWLSAFISCVLAGQNTPFHGPFGKAISTPSISKAKPLLTSQAFNDLMMMPFTFGRAIEKCVIYNRVVVGGPSKRNCSIPRTSREVKGGREGGQSQALY